MNATINFASQQSATGEKVHLLDKMLFYAWLLVPAYQYSDFHVENSRIGFWGIAAILLFRMSMRDLLHRRFILASRGLVLPFVLVFGWKLVELVRAPAQFSTALLFFFDFLVTYACCLLIAPRIFSVKSWLIEFRRVILFALVASMFLHPFLPARTDMAGWDKGSSWAFAHPNIAAMYPLVIYLITLIIFGTGVKRRVQWFDVFCVMFSLITLVMTGSRTTLGIAFIATLLALCNVFSFQYLSNGANRKMKALRVTLKLASVIVAGAGVYIVLELMGSQGVDAAFSGRWSFAVEVLLSAKDLVLGVGLLPPGSNLLADNSTRGAGIDGLYVNLIYGEGYVGLTIFVIAMLAFRRMTRRDRRFSAYFGVALASGLLFGVTESHFWLLASPLTALVAVMAGTLGTQTGSVKVVRIGAVSTRPPVRRFVGA
ncbi:hypothetical protein [Paraburkholderia silvatlantica]|uniref:hypothetical protein n=1 Tax=Paraburkholderia silvatlantica TaxID=321895 RepID=UPI0037506189